MTDLQLGCAVKIDKKCLGRIVKIVGKDHVFTSITAIRTSDQQLTTDSDAPKKCKVRHTVTGYRDHLVIHMAAVIKSGYLKKHSKSFMDGGWKNVWIVLHKDSYMLVFKKQGDSSPKAKIFMKEVCKWFAVGEYTDGMPDRPALPSGSSLDYLISIPQKPSSKSKIHWFLATSQAEFHEWMNAICSTLPPPTQHGIKSSASAPHVSSGPIQDSSGGVPLGHYPPPPAYNQGMPQPGPVGFGGMPQPSYGPPPPVNYPAPYPQQPYGPPQGQYPAPPPGQYPQQQYYPPPGGYAPPPGYQQQPYQQPYQPQQYAQPGYVQGGQPYRQGYATQPNVVYVQQGGNRQHKSGGMGGGLLSGNKGKLAAGVAGGALLGYGASRMMGGGMGMFGMGPRFGSWSSLSSCGSFGSFGSCGSWD